MHWAKFWCFLHKEKDSDKFKEGQVLLRKKNDKGSRHGTHRWCALINITWKTYSPGPCMQKKRAKWNGSESFLLPRICGYEVRWKVWGPGGCQHSIPAEGLSHLEPPHGLFVFHGNQNELGRTSLETNTASKKCFPSQAMNIKIPLEST